MPINSIIKSQLLINSPLEQFEVNTLDLGLKFVELILLNNIETCLLGNNLSFLILSVLYLYFIYLLAEGRAGQIILEGAICGANAGVIIETGKHLLNGNSYNNSGNSY
jgi:hypothetical protein